MDANDNESSAGGDEQDRTDGASHQPPFTSSSHEHDATFEDQLEVGPDVALGGPP
jgi:hypothetical protein